MAGGAILNVRRGMRKAACRRRGRRADAKNMPARLWPATAENGTLSVLTRNGNN